MSHHLQWTPQLLSRYSLRVALYTPLMQFNLFLSKISVFIYFHCKSLQLIELYVKDDGTPNITVEDRLSKQKKHLFEDTCHTLSAALSSTAFHLDATLLQVLYPQNNRAMYITISRADGNDREVRSDCIYSVVFLHQGSLY